MSQEQAGAREVATVGGGCFWCLEAVYDDIAGVTDVVSGYAGGTTVSPSYEQVCSGDTGHAEVVQVAFDPRVISYQEILDIFFSIHDPTTRDRQGNDVGTQYRSAIFTHSPEQKTVAQQTIARLAAAKTWNRPIVTEIVSLAAFYPAEDYHQEYFRNNPRKPYCAAIVAPKVAKAHKLYLGKLKLAARA